MILLKLRKWEILLRVVNKGRPLKKRPQVRKISQEPKTLRIPEIFVRLKCMCIKIVALNTTSTRATSNKVVFNLKTKYRSLGEMGFW